MSYIEKSIIIFLVADIGMTLFNILIIIYLIQKFKMDNGRVAINERYKEKVEKL